MTQFLIQTAWWVPGYGLLGALLTLPWSIGLVRRTGSRPAAYFNILMTLLALVHSVIMLLDVWNLPPLHIDTPWFQALDLNLYLSLEISRVSLGATILVTGLSLVAQVFALGYLEKDWALARFYALMGFFEGAITGLALSDSLFLSYALLEMLTLSTYLLVGFWYCQPLVVKAARDAFLTKRVGDLLLLMGVVALSTIAGTLDFAELKAWVQTADVAPLTATLLGLALVFGPTGKCAQFPLNLWLDEAMEGPNPASIMRNSVVVAGGAFVLIQMQPILALSPVSLNLLMVLGALTAIGASLVAIAQVDIKRALSHHTSASLGLVFLAVGMQQDEVALLFLFTHAIAKALQFMSVGSIILTANTQDLREMGGLGSRMPASTTAFVVGSLACVGLLPLGSFWSMQAWADSFWANSPLLVGILLTVNGLAAFNFTRIFFMAFGGQPQAKTRRAPEVPWTMAVPIVAMIIVALLVPLMLLQWHLLPSDISSVNWTTVALLIGSGALGLSAGVWLYGGDRRPQAAGAGWKPLQELLAHDFGMEQIYNLSVVFGVQQGSRIAAWLDRYVVDGMVNLMGFVSILSGESLKYTISGQSKHYLLTVFFGVVLGVVYLTWIF